MRRTRPYALAIALSCSLPLAAFAAAKQVGAEITVAKATPIADIVAAPLDYAGKVVRVEGEVSGVCTAKGCWMDIGDDAGHRIRVQVEDDVLVFPADAAGQPAVAEGTVKVDEVTREQYLDWQRHLASEGGEAVDEAKVGPGPFLVVQITGLGATIGG